MKSARNIDDRGLSIVSIGGALVYARLRVLLWLVVVLPGSLYAQRPGNRFEHITVEQGLSSNTVRALLQDRKGFLWIATPDGLNRYDGYRFTTYKNIPLDTTSLSHNWIYTIYEAPTEPDVLWVGTREGGLDRFDQETGIFTHYQHDADNPTSLSGNHVTVIYEDRAGTFWVGTVAGGLNRMDRATGTFTHHQHEPDNSASLSDNDVRALYEDRAGTFWVGTDDGLDRLDRATGTFTHYRHDAADPTSLSNDEITAIYEDRSGALWVGMNTGLNRLDSSTGAFTHWHEPGNPSSLSGNRVTAIYEDRAGTFWVGTNTGLNRLDGSTGTFTHYQHDAVDPTSLSNNEITAIYEDRSGVLWIGTTDVGLNTFDKVSSVFTHYRHDPGNPNSLSENHVVSVCEDHSGMLWIGTRDRGLNRLDPATGTFTQYRHDAADPNSLSGNHVTTIYEDRSGVLWVVAYEQGINRFDRATGAFARYQHEEDNPNSLSHTIVRAVYDDRAGQFWVGTKNGLDRLDRATGTFTHYQHEPGNARSLGHNNVRLIYEAPTEPGVLWIGTDGGLDRFDPATGAFTQYRHDAADSTSLSYNSIRAIYEDQSGTLWIGTRGGLNRMDRQTGRFTWFTEEDGLPNGVIFGIVEDEAGNLWLSTAKGLSKFNPERETFRNYDTDDGLLNREFEDWAFVKRSNGEILLGGLHGIDAFHPDSLRENRHVPPIVLTDFTTFGQSIRLGKALSAVEEIELSYQDNHFAFEFAALDYVRPQKNQYAYRLENLEPDWIRNGTRRIASYTNVDPGTYTFRIRGSNNDGLWNEEGLAIRVIIVPPFWQTWWFRIAALVALLGLLFTAYTVRVRGITQHNESLQDEVTERKRVEAERERLIAVLEGINTELEDKNAELERFTYTVSHDLKSPLVTIKGFLGLLQRDAARGNTERMNQDIAQIGGAADKMSRLLSELLELSRIGRQVNPPEAVALTDLAREAASLVAGSIQARSVSVEIDPAMPVVYGDRVRLLEVYQNLIDNAVKFMGDQPAPRVEIGAAMNGEEVVCSVRDNGLGIEAQYHEKIFGLFDRLDGASEGTGIGLALVRRIVEVHGGRIWVESEGKGRGSTFWFTVPFNEEAEAH